MGDGSALVTLNCLANLNYLAVFLESDKPITFLPKEMGNNRMLSLVLKTVAVAATKY